jgi:hypothetical protein
MSGQPGSCSPASPTMACLVHRWNGRRFARSCARGAARESPSPWRTGGTRQHEPSVPEPVGVRCTGPCFGPFSECQASPHLRSGSRRAIGAGCCCVLEDTRYEGERPSSSARGGGPTHDSDHRDSGAERQTMSTGRHDRVPVRTQHGAIVRWTEEHRRDLPHSSAVRLALRQLHPEEDSCVEKLADSLLRSASVGPRSCRSVVP